MSTASTIEREMLTLINEERTSRGLQPLQLETQLNDSSEDHSAWMLNTDTFSHTGSGGSTATQRMQAAGFDLEGSWRTGENIAWQSERGSEGISDDVAQLHQNLMNSPGHRANILNPDFEYIGIGVETGDMQGFDAVMVTQNFATTDAAVMLDSGASPEEPADAPVAEAPQPPQTPVTDPVAETPEAPEPTTPEAPTPVADTPEPPQTPDPVTEPPATPDPVAEAPEPAQPGIRCFDFESFFAEIEMFFDTLQARIDEFDWTDSQPVDMANNAENDPFVPTGTELPEAGVDEETAQECAPMTDLFYCDVFGDSFMLDAA